MAGENAMHDYDLPKQRRAANVCSGHADYRKGGWHVIITNIATRTRRGFGIDAGLVGVLSAQSG